MSADTFDCSDWGFTLTFSGYGSGLLLNLLQCTGPGQWPMTENDLAQDVSVNVEKPCVPFVLSTVSEARKVLSMTVCSDQSAQAPTP